MTVSSTFMRFCGVGAVNSALDIGIFLALRSGGFEILLANIVSTTIALGVSYALNKGYTFQTDGTSKSLLSFLAVTLCGLWIIQPIIIHVVRQGLVNAPNAISHDLTAKLVAIGVTFIWNYLWYSRLVFTKTD